MGCGHFGVGQIRDLVRREVEVRGAHGILDAGRGVSPRNRDHRWRECQLPGKNHLLHTDPTILSDELEGRAAGADRGGTPDAAERRPGQERNAELGTVLEFTRLDRNVGENWFCTETSRPPRTSSARSICSTLAFDRVRRLRRSRRSPGSARTAYRSPVGARLERPGRARYSSPAPVSQHRGLALCPPCSSILIAEAVGCCYSVDYSGKFHVSTAKSQQSGGPDGLAPTSREPHSALRFGRSTQGSVS